MRSLVVLGLGCAVCAAPAALHARPLTPRDTTPALTRMAADTTARIRFQIPAQPLAAALRDFARQSDLRLQVDAQAASSARSTAVSGTYTAPDALRMLLAGTGMTARIVGGETAFITRDGGDRTYAMTPVTVVSERSRGYGAPRTTTATKTDTPLRDAPQSVSVVTRQVIADQAMQGMSDVVRYVPGISMGQGEGHRDAPTIRGQSSTADFFVDGVRDDVQYLRDLYNTERVEALKGSNAMIFGRGGGGGVINRVTKEAQWAPTRAVTLEGGSFNHRRGMLDVGQGVGGNVALRFNGMYENSEGFRDQSELRRYGVNPTAALALGASTTLRAGYEYFHDDRRVDRGIPSFQGRPSRTDITTYFGNPGLSDSEVDVNSASATLEHQAGVLTIRNRARWASYDKFYQNSFPGAVTADGSQVALSAYNSSSDRENLFNQTDLLFSVNTAGIRHGFLAGAEFGRQDTDNFRNTGYYNNTAASFPVPIGSPTVNTPITFRQSATDADNRSRATVAAVYLQDQITVVPMLQLLGGVRFDRFDIDFHNNRNDEDLSRRDNLVSPRAGVIFKPMETASIYGSWSVSYLPSSGDQFGSLTATTKTLEPEEFTNREVGFKWDARSNLSLTAALYRLDRTNTTAPDPADPSRIVQTGAQRTHGWELGATGNITDNWQIVGGFARQSARIVSTTSAAKAGQRTPLVPERSWSLWNRVQVVPALGFGVGVVHQSDVFAAIDNTVTLPAFTRADAAVYLRVTRGLSVQANVENVLDERYYPTSQGNNNIMPGASRTLRLSLTTRR
ncbi:TonB-dependent siderophore receptor [Longimicrobium terrae]|uniref:Catecholate siderophore receptor n=1 Tax=Longimicrobium terrae TaxID=1639882 RepID=A0A841H250_9BACT|nr:TonB-dependent siderophore receptor [Longimicrobium terrae]MBB4637647.1 catecholate siderophore receptor [Longimicrobium terrae]MBB6072044.1 catecholate siderophore receptor [Longimicrobium terrae]NNC29872.1 TonB-dependent siderophore receptor [Longimicrobium terrae]